MVKGLFGMKKSEQIIFLDEDGVPTAFSSQMPDGIDLGIKVFSNNEDTEMQVQPSQTIEQEQPTSNTTPTPTVSVKGTLKFVQRTEHCRYQPTIQQNGKQATKWKMDTPFQQLQVDLMIQQNKKYYFEFFFDKLTCCMTCCLCAQDRDDNRQGEQGNISSNFGCGYVGGKKESVNVGIAINTIKQKWYIIDVKLKKIVKEYSINPFWISPKLSLWTKHEDATANLSDLKDYPNYIN